MGHPAIGQAECAAGSCRRDGIRVPDSDVFFVNHVDETWFWADNLLDYLEMDRDFTVDETIE